MLNDRRNEVEDKNQIKDLRTHIADVEDECKTLLREKAEAAEQQLAFDPWSTHLRWRPTKGPVVKKETK